MMANEFNMMVCTVGENPLPVYLGIAQLTKPDATIVLLHSNETRLQASRIADCLHNSIGNQRTVHYYDPDNSAENASNQSCLLDDPWDFRLVAQKMENHCKPGYVLNISGGTNVMTSTGYKVWKEKCPDNHIVYLEEKTQRFRFENGHIEKLECKVTPVMFSRLHGAQIIKKDSNIPHGATDYIGRIFDYFSNEELRNAFDGIPDYARRAIARNKSGYYFSPMLNWLRCAKSDKNKNCILKGIDIWSNIARKKLGFWEPSVSEIQLLLDTRDSRKFVYHEGENKGIIRNNIGKQINFVIGGFWFEKLVMDTLINDIGNTFQFSKSRSFEIYNQEFEIDGICIYENRFYVISITTDKKHSVIKEKSFEAMRRSQQLGGGLACSIVISPCEDDVASDCQVSVDVSGRHRIISVPTQINKDIDDWKNELVEKITDVIKKGINNVSVIN